MKKYKLYNRDLQKDYYARYDYIKIHKLNVNLQATKIVIESDSDVDLENKIVDFVNKMKEIAQEKDLKFLINNLTTITVNSTKLNIYRLKKIYGFYDIETNVINVLNDNYTKTINHELLHMSSSYYDKENGITYSGFVQSHGKRNIGLGITEGYTEYLVKKHFDAEGSVSNAYAYESKIASIIEKTIGEDKMLSLYLNANLYGLLEELAKYTSMHDAYMFIMNLDFITKNMSGKKILPSSKAYMMKVYREINIFLLKLSANKFYSIKGEKKQDEYLSGVLKAFPDKMRVNSQIFNITTDEEALKIYKEAYEKHKAIIRVKKKKRKNR